jgi:O-antigen ligase
MSPSALARLVRRTCLLTLVVVLVLFDAPFPARITLVTGAGVAGAITIGLALAGRGRGLWWGYGLYLVGVAISALVSRAIGSGAALLEQLSFVLVLWSVAEEVSDGDGEHRLAIAVGALTVVLALLLPQLAGPRSMFDYGRAYHYRALQQWSGYPELGVLFLLGAAATWAIVLLTRDRILRVAALVAAGGFALGIVVIQSRSALAVLAIVGVLMASATAYRWRSWLAAAALVGAVASAGAIEWRYPELTRRFRTASAFKPDADRPLNLRGDVWRMSWGLIVAHPWVGVGPGQFRRAAISVGAPGAPAHAHNLPLHVAAEYGLLTMACYLGLWGRVLYRTFRGAGPSLDGVAAWAVHAMLLAFFLRSLAEHFLAGLDSSPRMLMIVAVLFGLAESASLTTGPPRPAVD